MMWYNYISSREITQYKYTFTFLCIGLWSTENSRVDPSPTPKNSTYHCLFIQKSL